MTLRQAIDDASLHIARRDAELLLAHLLQQPRAFLLAHPEAPLPSALQATFKTLIARRAAHEPLQYITGNQEFYGLDFHVDPAVLIPRPETEHLVEAILLWATQFHDEHTLQIADVGTGSGAIAIALATHLAGAHFYATDISTAALEVARHNARTHGRENRIEFLHCDLLEGLNERFAQGLRLDAVLSNPPYVPADDAATMQPEVVHHEPHTALFAGADGLNIYRRLIPAAHAALRSQGLLVLEIGYGQRDAIANLLTGWHNVRFLDDYQGLPRAALAQRP